jgi:hypothetical protein
MRFTRYPGRYIDRDEAPNKRRLSSARRALQRERDKAPLFAREIAAEQPTPEGRIQQLDAGAAAWLADRRRGVAAGWKACRAELRSLPADLMLAILREWQYGYLPGSHEYLANLIHSRRRGDRPGELMEAQITAWVRGEARGGTRPGRVPKDGIKKTVAA